MAAKHCLCPARHLPSRRQLFRKHCIWSTARSNRHAQSEERAAAVAQIDQFIEQSPLKYEGKVGELGVSLSGGQRQRIGIARAIYKSSPVLVLDEATSALDKKTEVGCYFDSVLEIESVEVTILMIAHRISTLSNDCDFIVHLNGGRFY